MSETTGEAMTRTWPYIDVPPHRWGVATIDDGIFAMEFTRRDALMRAGFATPIKRERVGRLYRYTSEGGTQVYIGRVGDLYAEGFDRNSVKRRSAE